MKQTPSIPAINQDFDSNDPYVVLGLSREADKDEVKTAYKRLARANHPDGFTNPAKKADAEERIKKINYAYESISRADFNPTFVAASVASGFAGFDYTANDQSQPSGFEDAFIGFRKAEIEKLTNQLVINFPANLPSTDRSSERIGLRGVLQGLVVANSEFESGAFEAELNAMTNQLNTAINANDADPITRAYSNPIERFDYSQFNFKTNPGIDLKGLAEDMSIIAENEKPSKYDKGNFKTGYKTFGEILRKFNEFGHAKKGLEEKIALEQKIQKGAKVIKRFYKVIMRDSLDKVSVDGDYNGNLSLRGSGEFGNILNIDLSQNLFERDVDAFEANIAKLEAHPDYQLKVSQVRIAQSSIKSYKESVEIASKLNEESSELNVLARKLGLEFEPVEEIEIKTPSILNKGVGLFSYDGDKINSALEAPKVKHIDRDISEKRSQLDILQSRVEARKTLVEDGREKLLRLKSIILSFNQGIDANYDKVYKYTGKRMRNIDSDVLNIKENDPDFKQVKTVMKLAGKYDDIIQMVRERKSEIESLVGRTKVEIEFEHQVKDRLDQSAIENEEELRGDISNLSSEIRSLELFFNAYGNRVNQGSRFGKVESALSSVASFSVPFTESARKLRDDKFLNSQNDVKSADINRLYTYYTQDKEKVEKLLSASFYDRDLLEKSILAFETSSENLKSAVTEINGLLQSTQGMKEKWAYLNQKTDEA